MKKEELLREIVDNVGKRGGAGQNLQKVISVAMLSEGWDAKNVTHIMGLRAFTSQLLCEQVIGRGLRRVGYDKDDDGLFLPEYVNVFGVPLSIYEPGEGGEAPPPPKPSTSKTPRSVRNAVAVLPSTPCSVPSASLPSSWALDLPAACADAAENKIRITTEQRRLIKASA